MKKKKKKKKKKNAPLASKTFIFKYIPLQKVLGIQKSNHEITKVVSLVKLAEKLPCESSCFKLTVQVG